MFISFIIGLFTNKDDGNKNTAIWIIMIVMVLIPIIYFIYTGVKDLVYSAFNIKTKKEIIVEQKNTINKINDYNKDLNNALKIQTKVSDISINSVGELHKDIIKSNLFKNKVKSNLNKINANTYNTLKKEMKDINIYPPPKKQIVKTHDIPNNGTVDKNNITVNKEIYKVTGLNTFNNIEKMYLKVKRGDYENN